MPPAIAAAATASVRHLRNSQAERTRHQERAATLRRMLLNAGLPVLVNQSHIVPVMVGDAGLCKAASDMLLADHGIYIQPIKEQLRKHTARHLDVATDHAAGDVFLAQAGDDAVGVANTPLTRLDVGVLPGR